MRKIIQNRKLAEALAELNELTDWERRPRGLMRVGLEPADDLAKRLGNPHRAFRSIQVAGTKGKGSTCSLLEAAFDNAGYRVGRYASPHVEHITERVSLNGLLVEEEILGEAIVQSLAAYREALREGTPAQSATWFDILTVSAFLIFNKAGIDWAVIETGLGGRLDSTNIVDGEIAIITNIELEHTEVLGSSRAAIAREKAGIIKPRKAVVTSLAATDEAGRVVEERAKELDCEIYRPILPDHPTIEDRNAALAGLTLDILGQQGLHTRSSSLEDKPLGAWLLNDATRTKARLPGRLERFDIEIRNSAGEGRRVPVILDGAHVPFNLEAVLNDLASQPDLRRSCISIVALAADKDAAGFLTAMSHHPVTAIFTAFPTAGRTRSPDELRDLAQTLGMPSEVVPDPMQAFERACEQALKTGSWILVTGSLYLVGLLREAVAARSAPS
ncbi:MULTISPECIES: folylpolyglutamate synthase/dihydrofolate synthase family protein [unclassified Sinorhizobium]|uniref:bifunctional folylpolyglutamate synthase/dihydrofolate synthase n=1 Tax=unclassified Sinorhizobium TaxID=2613772 RepID=UPI0035266151